MARAYFYNYRTKAIFDEFSTHFSGFLKTGHLISIGEIKHLGIPPPLATTSKNAFLLQTTLLFFYIKKCIGHINWSEFAN